MITLNGFLGLVQVVVVLYYVILQRRIARLNQNLGYHTALWTVSHKMVEWGERIPDPVHAMDAAFLDIQSDSREPWQIVDEWRKQRYEGDD